jgi:hypothetical protein
LHKTNYKYILNKVEKSRDKNVPFHVPETIEKIALSLGAREQCAATWKHHVFL